MNYAHPVNNIFLLQSFNNSFIFYLLVMSSLNLSRISRSLVYISSTLGLLTISNLVFVNSAGAFGVTFSGGTFENTISDNFDTGLTNWESTGDVTTNTGISGVSPLSSPNQAIINTGYRNLNDRIDDRNIGGSYLNFNQSGTDPIDADSLSENNSPNTDSDLQSFLNLNTSAFSIARRDSLGNNIGGFRLPKEGSGMYQDIVVSITQADKDQGKNGFDLNFNWAYLSNDGTSLDFGNQDFSFLSIAANPTGGSIDQTDSRFTNGIIELLGDSDGDIRDDDGNIDTYPTADNNFIHSDTTYYNTNNVYTKSITGLEPGTYSYRVGFGTVDVDNLDRTSALLVDSFSVERVPFEFSPTLGLLFVGSMFGLKTAWQKRKSVE